MDEINFAAESFRREMRSGMTDLRARIKDIEEEQKVLSKNLASALARMEERCPHHTMRMDKVEGDVDELKAAEHRRKGGVAIMCVLFSIAAALGGLIAKLWPHGGS